MKLTECNTTDEIFTFQTLAGVTYNWNATKVSEAFTSGKLEPVCHMYLDITEADYLHISLNNGIEEDHLLTITPERLKLPVFYAEFPPEEGEEYPSHVLIDGNHRLVQTYRNGGRRMISLSTLGSRPLATPRAMASLVPAIKMPSSMLLQILAVWPAPTAPAWKMLAPIFSRMGRARSRSAASRRA